MIAVEISGTAAEAGRRAALYGASRIRAAVAEQGRARIVLATGVSQFPVLETLVAEPGIEWRRVTAFHLDEYIGLGPDHPAGFRRFLRERFTSRVEGVAFVPVDGDADPAAETARLGGLIGAAPVDVCFAGLGENCHLAFNDPPADFATVEPYIEVVLDEACRRQQLGAGWFPTLDDVPRTALSMSIAQILSSRTVVLTVTGARKAVPVRDMLQHPVDPMYPGTVLQEHLDTHLFLDRDAAALLS